MENKQIKLGMLLNYISMAIEGIIVFLLNPFIIRGLGQEEYGVYSLVSSFAGYLTIFEFGLGTTIIRYISKYNAEKKEKEKENFLAFCFIIYFVIAIIMAIVCVVLYYFLDHMFDASLTMEQIELAKKMFMIIATSMTLTTIGSIFSAIIAGYERFIFSRVLVIATTIINVLLTILVLATKATAIRLTYITLIITVITIFSNIYYVFKKIKIKIKLYQWDHEFFKEISKFSIFIFLQTMITQIYWRLDQLIIGVMVSNAAISLAIYSVAMKINDLVLSFTTVINRYQLPTITRMVLVEKDQEKVNQYIGKTSKFVAILYMAIMIGFAFFGKKFIQIYAGDGYELAYYVVLIVIIASSLSRIHGSGSDVLKAKNLHGYYTIIVLVTAIMNILITVALIPHWGIIGAAIGTAISVILGNTVAYYWCLQKKAKIDVQRVFKITFKGFAPVCFLCAIICLLCNWLLGDSLWEFILKCFIFGMTYLIAIYRFVLDEQMKQKVRIKMRR